MPPKQVGKSIIVIVPPLAIEDDAIRALKNDYAADIIETDKLQPSHIEHKSTNLRIVLVTSLSVLSENVKTHTDKLYYFMFNYTEEYLNKQCLINWEVN